MAIYAPVSPFFRHFVSFVCLLVCDQKDLLPLICDQKDLLPLICDQKDLLPLSHALLLLCVFSLSLHFPRIVSREKETSMLNCCFRGARVSKTDEGDQQGIATDLVSDTLQANRPVDFQKETSKNENQGISSGSSSKHVGRIFQLSELAAATMNFKNDHCLGEGAFGNVYKGRLESTDQIVAIKRLHRTDAQGHNEFLLEALMMSLLHHPNVIDLIGYCTSRNERILVFEYLPLGSLEDHLHKIDPNRKVLDWNARMRIAAGAAKGLEYLHDQLSPPVIHRDVKSSNILLDEGYHPKICDFGMAKLGPTGDDTHVSTRAMGTCGYCAPEYVKTGRLTTKSDIYSFGVVLLELITGRRAIDTSRPADEYSLVVWVLDLQIFETGEHALASSPKFSSHFFLHCQKIVIQALQNFKNRDTFPEMIDPKLEGQYPTRDLYCALDIAQMYLHKRPSSRPMIAEVVAALSYLASKMYRPKSQPNLKALSMNEPTVVVVTQALSSTKSNTCKEKEE